MAISVDPQFGGQGNLSLGQVANMSKAATNAMRPQGSYVLASQGFMGDIIDYSNGIAAATGIKIPGINIPITTSRWMQPGQAFMVNATADTTPTTAFRYIYGVDTGSGSSATSYTYSVTTGNNYNYMAYIPGLRDPWDSWQAWVVDNAPASAVQNDPVNAAAQADWELRRQERAALIEDARRAEAVLVERERLAHEEEKVRAAAADEKADRLLMRHLSEEQRAMYQKNRFFEVRSRTGRRVYRLRPKWSGNVEVFGESGVFLEKMCIHPAVQVPIPDHLLAQKFMIELDEERFRRIANRTLPSGEVLYGQQEPVQGGLVMAA